MQAKEVINAFDRIPWIARFLLGLLMPWLVVIGLASAAEVLAPGQVKVDLWRFVASSSFFASGAVCVYMVSVLRRSVLVRLSLVALVLLWSAWFAFMFQLHWNCGDETQYLGQKPAVGGCQ